VGKILNAKRCKSGVVFETHIDYDEATLLQGHYEDVHLFSEHVAEFNTDISSRGKNSCTKYFLIPRLLRKDLDLRSPVSCQKIETPEKVIFIYVVDKFIPK